MDKLVLIPPIITIVLLYSKGFGWTFANFWLPLLLAVPVYLEMDGPGIPPLSFYLTGFLPFLFRQELRQAAFEDRHSLDVLVYAYVLSISIAETITESFTSGRQLLFLNGLALIGPYLAMKYTILHERSEIRVARVFVYTLCVIGVYNVYTWRMGLNHFAWLRQIWPNYYQLTNLAVLQRWGYWRAAGPFVHPITAGIIFGFGLPMTFWLARYKKVKPAWTGLILVGLCLLGLMATMSRGPFIGAFLAGVLFLMGQSKFRVQLFVICGLLALFASVPISFKIAAYMSLDRSSAVTIEQETVLYRKELITNYMDIIKVEPLTGYGFLNVPYVEGQKSIDNAYIYLALCWGIFPVLALLGIASSCLIGLFRLGFKNDLPTLDRAVVWSLAGGIAGCMFSLATVFLARPASSILFMWAGWSVAMLLRVSQAPLQEESVAVALPKKEPGMVIL